METQSNVCSTDTASISQDQREYKLITVRQFCSMYPWPSELAMRAYVYRAKDLGIAEAFVRVRRRVLVDPKKFFTLIKDVDKNSQIGGTYERRRDER